MNPLVILGALVFDLAAGEPPAGIHPVVWMGKLITWFEQRRPQEPKAAQAWGVRMVAAGVLLSFVSTWIVMWVLGRIAPIAALIGGMLLLKVTFAVGALGKQALRVQRALEHNDLEGAQLQVRNLVSREVNGLAEREVISATVESVAENTLDSIVAPLFWFLILGVPGAMAYRFVNTADAMVGYHGEYEYFGRAAARLDDALNWIPARISAGLLVAGSWI
ncbi:MAG: cobalamin biosynthesis protein CobD, partial [Chloroflexi bacterium]|nr:cobalamin biosynthesis protein CobD [Chloroflexota bacterium]